MNNFKVSVSLPCRKVAFVLLLGCTMVLLQDATAFAQDASHSPAGWVVIPVDQYRELHARAYPTEREPEPPPVEATLTRVDYDLHVINDLATGRATLTVDILKDGWVHVPIPSGLLVREARLDGKLLSLVSNLGGKGSGQLSAVLSHAGRAVLMLDIALPVAASQGNESISLPSTASGITRASVQLPKQSVDMKLSGGLLQEQSEAAGESKFVAYGKGTEPVTFTWRRKIEDHRVSQPLRMRGSITQLVGLGEDSSSINAEVKLEVTQGQAKQVRFQLPEKVTINQVLGAMVADWEVKAGELAVTFLEPVEQSARFVIVGETRLPRDGQFSLPLLRLLDAERETGGVAVEVLGAGEIKNLKTQGLESADATDLGPMVANRQSPSLAAFRFHAGDSKTSRSLSVDIARYTQQAVLMANVEEARYQVLMSKEGKTLVQAHYAIRNNQRNFVKIVLPQGAVLWSAALAGKPVRPGQASDGSLLLPLEKARSGEEAPEFALEIMYLGRGPTWDEKGKERLALPSLDLPISRTGVVLFYPPLFRVTPEPGAFRAQSYEGPLSSVLNDAFPPSSVLSESRDRVILRREFEVDGQNNNDRDELKDQKQAALVDQFWAKSPQGRAIGVLPVRVMFPDFGPSIFLVSELTAENQAPFAELDYQSDKKGGAR